MDVLARMARSSKIGSVRIKHRVSPTGNGRRKQDVEIIFDLPIGFPINNIISRR